MYLLARSRFLKGEIISSKENFLELVSKFPDSKYVDEARLWILFSNVQLFELDDFNEKINDQNQKQLSNSNRFLLNKINAEYYKKLDNLDSCYHYYLNALNYTENQSQKISVYSNLSLISSENKDYNKSIEFIDILEDFSKGRERVELSLKKIEYYKKLNNFDQIILEIPMMLDSDDYKSKRLYLELELAKAYMNKGDFRQAKEYFIEITDNNQKKDETAESFYWLGMMSIKESFDLILADDYFEKSKLDKSSSRYGRESKDILLLLSKYDKLVELYNTSINSKIDQDTLDVKSSINIKGQYGSADSLYMMMIDMMNFDFGRSDKAIEEYKKFVDIYSQSKYIPQVYYILSTYDSSSWQLLIDEKFPKSKYSTFSREQQNDDKLEALDKAWDLIPSNSQQSFKEFVGIGRAYSDTSSFYLAAFIADRYMNSLDSALVYYSMFIDSFPNHTYSTASKFRINEIKDMLAEKVEFINNLLIYNNAVNTLRLENDLDSSKVLFSALSNAGRGENFDFSKSAKMMKDKISYFQNLTESLFQVDTLKNNDRSVYVDSLYYYRSYEFETLFNSLDSAKFYYNLIIENFKDSKFFNKSIMGIYRINKKNEFLDKINKDIIFDWSDTITSNSYLVEDYILDQEGIREKKKYLSKIQKYIDLIPSDSLIFSDTNVSSPQSKVKSSDIPDIEKIKKMQNFKIDLNIPE